MNFVQNRIRDSFANKYTVTHLLAIGAWMLGGIAPGAFAIFELAQGRIENALLAAAAFGVYLAALLGGSRTATLAAAQMIALFRLFLLFVPRVVSRSVERFILRGHRTRKIENLILAYIDSRRPGRTGSAFARAVATGDRRAAAETIWPRAEYPHFYAPVPADLQRAPFEDGTLHGDVGLDFLADNALSELQIRRAVRAAAATFLIVLAAIGALLAIGTISTAISQIGAIRFSRETIESWGEGREILSSIVGALLAAGGDFLSAIWNIVSDFAVIALLVPVFAASLAAVSFLSYIGSVFSAAQLKFKFPTKDLVGRFPSRIDQRREGLRSYAQTVELAQTRLADKKTIELGSATGTARMRGRLYAPSAATPICIDEESLAEGTAVIGSTGSGKTSGPIKNILYTVLSWTEPTWSAYLQDGKGVLHNDVRSRIEKLGRKIVTIGTEANEKGVNLLAFLSPLEAAEAMRALSRQMSDEKNVWSEQAAALFRHALVVARVWRETADGQDYKASVADPYSIAGAFNIAASEKLQARAIKAVNRRVIDDAAFGDRWVDVDFETSRHYLDEIWPAYAIETRTSVQFSLDALLGEITAQPELYRRFYRGRAADTVDFADLLDGSGTVYLSAIGGAKHGKNGRIVNMLLNTILVKLAGRRQVEIGEAEAKKRPVLAIVDECHLTLSFDREAAGTDVPSFLSVTRSSGVAWVLATQSVDQLYASFGEEPSKTLLANLRNKIFLSSENIETINLVNFLGGNVERNFVLEMGTRESIDQRMALDGFDPLSPSQWIPRVDVRDVNTKFGDGISLAFTGLPTTGVMSMGINGSFAAAEAAMNPQQAQQQQQQQGENTRARDEGIIRHGNTREALYRTEDLADLGDFHAIVFVRRGRNLHTDKIRVRHIFE